MGVQLQDIVKGRADKLELSKAEQQVIAQVVSEQRKTTAAKR